MNLHVSIGCYILSVYLVFCGKSDHRTRHTRYVVDRRGPEESEGRPVGDSGKHTLPAINPKDILDSLIFTNELAKPVPRPRLKHSRKWRWVHQPRGSSDDLALTPINQGQVYESLAMPGDAINKLADASIKFNLYTSRNPTLAQVLTIDSSESLHRSYFKPNIKTVFITHGWLNSGNVGSITVIRDAYLSGKSEEVNVIAVDWSAFGVSLYNWSADKVETLGNQVARMINFLRSQSVLQLEMTTLVGHSLGAHVMGVAGRNVTGGKVNQIFGLDPPRLSFINAAPKYRLSPTSARHVQVIHTNGGNQGLIKPLGHADFYPNGGSTQPGCLAVDFFNNEGCSHAQAFWLFAESLNSVIGFRALKCKTGENPVKGQCSGRPSLMGGRSNQIDIEGSFYLQTAVASPYALKLRRRDPRKKNLTL